MMFKRNKYWLVLLMMIYLLSACVKQIELKLSGYNSALVVNSLITPDSLVTIYVSATLPILETEPTYVNDATVLLWENDHFADTLRFITKGIYQSTITPIENSVYRIEVSAPNFSIVYASDTVPEKIVITNGYYTIIHALDEFNDSFFEYTIKFQDQRGVKNYYDLAFIGIKYDRITDSTRINYNFFVAYADPVIYNEGDLDYEPISFVFSDELIDGQYYVLNMRLTPIANSIAYPGKLLGIEDGEYVLLKSVTKSFYEYRKSWIRHYFTQSKGQYVVPLNDLVIDDITGLLFAQDPVAMSSNIENGYGVFAAYTNSLKKLRLVE